MKHHFTAWIPLGHHIAKAQTDTEDVAIVIVVTTEAVAVVAKVGRSVVKVPTTEVNVGKSVAVGYDHVTAPVPWWGGRGGCPWW